MLFRSTFYCRVYPYIRNKIITISNGVDLNVFKPLIKSQCRKELGYNATNRILLYVGRLEKEKNLFFLLEVYKIVKLKIPECRLVIVGSGTEETALIEKAKSENLTNIDFVGEVKNSDLPKYINCADVFAFCSLFEGSPIIIREVLACNVPVVSLDVGDVKTLIKQFDGCAISPNNTTVFATRICEILEQRQTFNYQHLSHIFSSKEAYYKTLEKYNSVFYGENHF